MEVLNLKDFLSWHPPAVQEIISNGILLPESKLVLHGKYKSWKCVHKDTYILVGELGAVPISSVDTRDCKVTFTTSGYRSITAAGISHTDKAVKITTYMGFELVCSPDHKILLSKDSYIKAGDIKVDDVVLINYNSNVYGTSKVLAPYILGLLMGDGSFATENYIGFTSQNLSMCNLINTVFPGSIKNHDGHYQLNCYGYREIVNKLWGIPTSSISSHTKVIPSCIMETTLQSQAQFIRGLMDTDGSITDRGVDIELSNHNLIKQLQLLLSNMGIISKILPRPDHNSWKLYCGGSDAHKFKQIIYEDTSEYEHYDSPHEKRKLGLKRLYSDGHWLYPDKIISVEDVDGGEFYDIEVDKVSNFIASGIVVHNSMLAMDMALCIAEGKPWFNHTTSKVPVFSLQIEVAKAAYQNRLLKYTKHNDCLSSNLFVATEHYIKIDSSFGMNDLDKAIKLCSPKVVVIDPLYKVLSGDLNDSRDVVKFEDNIDILIDKYHCAFIIVHHEHKMKFDNDGNRVRQGAEAMTGSQMIANWADSVIGVEVTTSDYENPVGLTITFTALRNSEYFPRPINILINRDNLTFKVDDRPPKITPELQKLIDGALNPVNKLEEPPSTPDSSSLGSE